jgi:carboxymethylenebutenolidase
LRDALRNAPVDSDIVRYAEAGHGFHCDQRPDFRPDEAKDAWSRMLAWLDAHLQH